MQLTGSLSLLILHVLARGPSHGYAIGATIRQHSAGVLEFREGTLYPTLHSLEERGLIAAAEEQVAEGRTRRSYKLTEAGHLALAEELAAWQRYSRAISVVLDAPTGGA